MDLTRWALAHPTCFEIQGSASKRGWGRACSAEHVLALTELTGIVDYAPEELMVTARAGTPLADLTALLRRSGQRLAFDPPDLGGIWRHQNAMAQAGTLGGAVACNLSGPLRLRYGAARDHILGARFINGRGETIRTGGKVFKNVTGYDLCKLLAGSFGTLGVITEITVKSLPLPASETTVRITGLSPMRAQKLMAYALSNPFDTVSAGFVPGLPSLRNTDLMDTEHSHTFLRLEGQEPALTERARLLALRLRETFDLPGTATSLEPSDRSALLWRLLGSSALLPDGKEAPVLWRVHIPPTALTLLAEWLGQIPDCAWFADWGGGLVWIAFLDTQMRAGPLRDKIAGQPGAHATLMRAPVTTPADVPVFHPRTASLASLQERVRKGFDPMALFNPGRLD